MRWNQEHWSWESVSPPRVSLQVIGSHTSSRVGPASFLPAAVAEYPEVLQQQQCSGLQTLQHIHSWSETTALKAPTPTPTPDPGLSTSFTGEVLPPPPPLLNMSQQQCVSVFVSGRFHPLTFSPSSYSALLSLSFHH